MFNFKTRRVQVKKLYTTIAALLVASAVFAQDFDGFDSSFEEEENPLTFSGDVGADFRAYINTNEGYKKTTTTRAQKYLKKSKLDILSDQTLSTAEKSYYLGKITEKSLRDNIVDKTVLDSDAAASLSFNYNGSNSEISATLCFDAGTIKDYPEDIVNEVVARGYFGNWVVEAGKMKVVWGKGDKLHVLDNFNANDYTDFIFPDYIDRRIAEPMIRVAYNVPNASNIRIEGIVTPTMTADRFASSGQLAPYTMTKLTDGVTTIVSNNLNNSLTRMEDARTAYDKAAADYTSTPNDANKAAAEKAYQTYLTKQAAFLTYLTFASGLSSNSDQLFPDTKSLKYAQAGARITGTLGSMDWGFSYYYGHYKQPSAKQKGYADTVAFSTEKITELFKAKALANPLGVVSGTISAESIAKEYFAANKVDLTIPELNYDKLQVFGFEFAKVLWKFNTRGEIAYNLTEDHTGSNPWVKNNSIAWLGGFDIDLPIHNLNINFQETGNVILKRHQIRHNKKKVYNAATGKYVEVDYSTYDVDYKSDGKYYSNKLVVNISDKFLYEKLTTECTAIYVLPTKELCVQPKISYNVIDGLTFTLSGGYIYSNNENGEFYNFTAGNQKHHNLGFAQISAKYVF